MPRRGENIRKRKVGRWDARFSKGKNEKGRIIYGAVYGSTYKKAKAKRRQRLENPPVAPANCTDSSFSSLLALWIADNQVRLKASTIYRYQYLIDTHILPELGIKSMDSITSTVTISFCEDYWAGNMPENEAKLNFTGIEFSKEPCDLIITSGR